MLTYILLLITYVHLYLLRCRRLDVSFNRKRPVSVYEFIYTVSTNRVVQLILQNVHIKEKINENIVSAFISEMLLQQ